jgi:hypothetical protein
MKWFFALKYGGRRFAEYAELVKVAVHSAGRFTSLAPHCLYDGPDCELTAWLRGRGVAVIPARSFLHERLREVAERRNDPDVLAIGGGALLRTELPALAGEMGIADEFVVYTDLDVMFRGEVVDYLSQLRPHLFAVAPEFDRLDYIKMNTGVMVMNLPGLRVFDASFRELMVSNFDALVAETWDQTAYRHLFRTVEGVPLWDRMLPQYNWKPYWGFHPDIRIIHFHGPKPRQHDLLTRGEVPEHLGALKKLAVGIYDAACQEWEQLLLEVDSK